MNQIGGPVQVELMPLLLQTPGRPWLWKLLSGKRENYVSPFVSQGHSIGERVPSRDPPDIHAQRLVDPSSRRVEGLVAQRLAHPHQLRHSWLLWLFCNKPHDSRHFLVLKSLLGGLHCARVP